MIPKVYFSDYSHKNDTTTFTSFMKFTRGHFDMLHVFTYLVFWWFSTAVVFGCSHLSWPPA